MAKPMTITLPYPPSLYATVRGRRVDDASMIAAYRDTGSVWLSGELLGISGQSVYKRLKKLGIAKGLHHLSECEKDQIRNLYAEGMVKGDGKLDALAKSIGRTKQFISRFAKSESLTTYRRRLNPELRRTLSASTRERWKTKPHPRGALGMRHSAAARMKISWSSRKAWGSLSQAQRTAMTERQLRAKLLKSGTLIPLRHKVSWKQGWREISGARIYFRSRWEFNYAVYLQFLVEQKQIAKWEHEPETFWFSGVKRGCVTYLPDFRVTNCDGSIEYHEVKGWMDDRSKTKLRRMKKYHPAVKLRVIDGKWFKANGPKLSFLKGWES